ncbi:hypothetical protein BDQ17DRAFT_1181584, partial [Cyathus striatus]
GAHLLSKQEGFTSVTFAIDNQASISAAGSHYPRPGHYICDEFLTVLTEAIGAEVEVTLCWVPGHWDIEGNEVADQEAKRAITQGSHPRKELPHLLRQTLPISNSAINSVHKKKIKAAAESHWRSSPCHPRVSRNLPAKSSSFNSTLLLHLPRKLTSLITQLVTGHIALNKHLHRIGKVPSPMCGKCFTNSPETVDHFLLRCP